MKNPIHIIICEDVLEVREGFRYLLDLDPEIKVNGAYPGAEEMLEDLSAGKIKPDIILMDIVLPGIDGITATGEIKNLYPDIDVLILTIFEEKEKIMEAIEKGASGYILKNTKPGELVAQIKEMRDGGSPVSPHVARKLFSELRREHHRPEGEHFHLTEREREIVRAIVDGLTYREIAERYNIAGSTVKKHILNIYKKLEVRSKVEFMKKVMGSDLL
ncbi:MAG: response regulator transcription factor [Spirochaetia bacterium]